MNIFRAPLAVAALILAASFRPLAAAPPEAPGGGTDSLVHPALRREDPAAAGFDPARLRDVENLVRSAIRDSAFPGAQLAILRNGSLVWDGSYGTCTYEDSSDRVTDSTLFDLASLTKVVATTTSVMLLVERRKIRLDDPVSRYIPAFAAPPHSAITIRHLLLHRSGFPPFRKLWQFCPSEEAVLDSVYATPLAATPGDSTHSDLGFITLGKVVENVSGISLAQFVSREITGPLGMRKTFFNPGKDLRPAIAPTEYDSLTKALVRGTVHDENAAFLGGVSGHAGLFSNATDLARFVRILIPGSQPNGQALLSESVITLFTRTRPPGQDRYLGWDSKSPRGSSAGTLFSAGSFGHTGFTGTSIWVDPDRSIAVIFLTNRVCPTRDNLKIAVVRPRLHDAVVSALKEPPVSHEVSPGQ